MQGYVPAQGNQHGGKLGMGSIPQHPINTPLMPQANSFYAYLNSDHAFEQPFVQLRQRTTS